MFGIGYYDSISLKIYFFLPYYMEESRNALELGCELMQMCETN